MRLVFIAVCFLLAYQLLSQELVIEQVDKNPIYNNCLTSDCIESDLNKFLRSCSVESRFEPVIWESEYHVSFIIDEYGSTRSYRLLEDYNSDLSRQLLRAVRSLKRWSPALLNGEPVTLRYVLSLEIIGTIGSYKVIVKNTLL